MPATNVIQLRQLLSERFPGLRMHLEDTPLSGNFWATGLPQIDRHLGGLPKSGLTELVANRKSAGAATLLRALLNQAAQEGQIAAVIDGQDSLDVTQIDESTLSRMLWVRCRSAEEAMKSADFILRDNNLSLVFLDLVANPASQLRRIPATMWYRLQRLVEESATACAVLTPWAMVSSATARFTLNSQFSLHAQEVESNELLAHLKVDALDSEPSRLAKESSA